MDFDADSVDLGPNFRDRSTLQKITEIRLESVAYLYFTENTDFWHPLSFGKRKRWRFTLTIWTTKIIVFLRSEGDSLGPDSHGS